MGLERDGDVSPRPWLEPWRVLAYAAVLEGVKVSPKVDLLLLAPAEEGVKVGLRDEVLCLSLDSHVVRMSFFNSIRSASVALKSSNESRHRTSLHTL